MPSLLKVGDLVKVLAVNDVCPADEPTHAQEFIGKIGVVKRLTNGGVTGDSVMDPLYIVRFADVQDQDGFWFEELEKLS